MYLYYIFILAILFGPYFIYIVGPNWLWVILCSIPLFAIGAHEFYQIKYNPNMSSPGISMFGNVFLSMYFSACLMGIIAKTITLVKKPRTSIKIALYFAFLILVPAFAIVTSDFLP